MEGNRETEKDKNTLYDLLLRGIRLGRMTEER